MKYLNKYGLTYLKTLSSVNTMRIRFLTVRLVRILINVKSAKSISQLILRVNFVSITQRSRTVNTETRVIMT